MGGKRVRGVSVRRGWEAVCCICRPGWGMLWG